MCVCCILKVLILQCIVVSFSNSQNVDQPYMPYGYCADYLCSEPLSYGVTSTNYIPIDANTMGFGPGMKVAIYATNCGTKQNLLGVEIDGKRGYVPRNLIKETRALRSASFNLQTDFLNLPRIQATTAQNVQSPTQAQNGFTTTSMSSNSIAPPGNQQPSPVASHSSNIPSNIPSSVVLQSFDSNNLNPGSAHPSQQANVPPGQEPSHPTPQMNINSGAETTYPTHQDNIPSESEFSHSNVQLNTQSSSTTSTSNLIDANTVDHSHYNERNVMSSEKTLSEVDMNSNIFSPSLPNFQDTASSVSSSSSLSSTSGNINLQNNHGESSHLSTDSDISNKLNPIDTSPITSNTKESLHTMTDLEHTLSKEDEEYTRSILEKLEKGEYSSPNVDKEESADQTNLGTTESHSASTTSSASPQEMVNIPNSEISHQPSTIENQSNNTSDSIDVAAKSITNDENNKDKGDNNSDHTSGKIDEFENEDDEENEEEGEDEDEKEDEEEPLTSSTHENSVDVYTDENSTSMSSEEFYNESPPKTENNITGPIELNSSKDSLLDHDKPSNVTAVSVDSSMNGIGDATTSSAKELFQNNATKDSESENIAINSNGFNEVHDDVHSTWNSRSILQNDNSSSIESDTISEDEVADQPTEDNGEDENGLEDIDEADLNEVDNSSLLYDTFNNFVEGLRTFLDYVITFVPEPIYSYIIDLDTSGISSRAIVFTAVTSVPCGILFLSVLYLKKSSKEQHIIDKLSETEHQLYLTSTEKNLFQENVESLEQKVAELEISLHDEKSLTKTLQGDLEGYQLTHQNVSAEQKENLIVIRDLKKQIKDYENTIGDLEKSLKEATEKVEQTLEEVQDEKQNSSTLTEKNEELLEDISKLKSEKETYIHNEKLYTSKIAEYEEYCNQLCQDADLRNTRISELSDELTRYEGLKEQLETEIENKSNEIELLRTALTNLEVIQKLKDSDGSEKTIEEKLVALMDISSLQNKLKKAQAESEIFSEKLKEKTRECDEIKVDKLELNSEVEKLNALKEQAVEEKIDVQRKLEILEKYFKDKEVQLQKELGTQLTARQQKEVDVSQAERTIYVLKEENASLREQVKTLKQEVEETERSLKKQVTSQEEIAHKNWVAARAAERNVDKLKQDITQFRQRLTLLEREREKETWSSDSELLKPIPQRLSDSLHNISQEGSVSSDFKNDLLHQRGIVPPPPPPPLLHHMMPPPMGMPPFMPPFDPLMPPPSRRPPPWHLMQDKSPPDFDRRRTPSDFRHSSMSPPGESSHSRNSSPLPDFHNVPPQAPRYGEGPPPLPSTRYIPPPPPGMHRREREIEYSSRFGKSTGKGSRKDSQNTSHDRDYDPHRQHYDADV